MDVILQDGIVTDYDDFYLWIEEPKANANAKYVAKDEDGEAVSITPAKIKKIIIHSQFDSEEAYSDASDEMMSGEFDATAEFVTADDTYYVGIELTGDEEQVDSFDTGSAEYC